MERVVEPEPNVTNIEVEFDEQETYELEFASLREDEVEASSSGNRNLYGKTFGGIMAIVSLLIVPMVTLPGMVILVLFAEIYLVDWTYGKVKELRGAGSAPARIRSSSPTERKNPRKSPKDQFVK